VNTGLRFSRFLLAVAALLAAVAMRAEKAVPRHPFTPFSLEAALTDAHLLAARHPGAGVVRVEGRSMLPFFGDGSVLVVKRIAAADLRVGMVVVYTNRFGETVAHRVVAGAPDRWTVRGYNNDAPDTTVVNDANLHGVVYATFYSNGRSSDPRAYEILAADTRVALAAPAR